MSLDSFIHWLRKDAPVAGDTHVSTSMNIDGRAVARGPKKKKPGEDDDDHLPVTNMTLAAQQITGQQTKPTAKFSPAYVYRYPACENQNHGLNPCGLVWAK